MAMRQPAADPEDVRRIIRLIDTDPEIRDEVRRALLTRELLELPQQLAAFAEATERRFEAIELQFQAIDRRFQTIEADLAILKSDVGVLKSDVGTLKSDVGTLKSDVGTLKSDSRILVSRVDTLTSDVGVLKGSDYERRVRDRAPTILRRVAGGVRRLRVIPDADLADQLDEAVEDGRITDAERDDALNADVVLRGVSRTSGQPVHLTVEASVTIGKSDVSRAIRRSRVILRAVATEGAAVVVTARAPARIPSTGVEIVRFGSDQERGAA